MGYMDLAVGLGFFLFFLAVVLMLSIQHFVGVPTKLTIEEYRERAVALFERFFSTMGSPSNWENTGVAPSELGLITTIYRIPVTVKETNSTNRVNEPVAVNLDFDDECSNKAWNNTIRVYDENLNEIPYQLSHENFCTSQFLKNSTVTFEVNISANQEKEFYVWYSPDDSITGPNYTLSIKGYWKFDDGSGTTATDSSGDENDGALYNGSVVCSGGDCPNWVDGKYGKGLSFDGVDDYVGVPSSASLKPTEAITVTGWIKPDLQGTREFMATKWQGFTVELATSNRVTAGVYVSGGQRMTPVSSVLPNNTWTHVAFTYDSSDRTLKTYINGGQEIKSSTLSGLSTYSMSVSNNALGIGRYSSYYWNGQIDEVRIYNRALSPTEINATLSSPLVVKTFPEEKIQVVSKKKIDALENITYEQLRDVTGEDYRFRIEIVS